MQELWIYFAGFFDGEGNIYLNIHQRKKKYKNRVYEIWEIIPRLTVCNTQKEELKKLEHFLNMEGINTCWHIRKSNGRKNPLYEIIISAWDSVENCVLNLLPFSIFKSEQLRLMKKAVELHKSALVHKRIRKERKRILLPKFKIIASKISKLSHR